MPDVDSSATSGVEVRGYRRGAASTDGWDQYVVPVRDRVVSYSGRAGTFRTPSRAATTQNVLAIFNASATTIVAVNRVLFDIYQLTAGAATVHPPIVRISRLTAVPTNGTALSKVAVDTTMTSDASVTLFQDASADGTSSGTAMAATIAAGTMLTQEVCSRLITVGTANAYAYEVADRMEFFVGQPDITLRQNQGLVMHLIFPAAPVAGTATAGLHSIGVIDWEEYTRP